jgi:hypothetical protein
MAPLLACYLVACGGGDPVVNVGSGADAGSVGATRDSGTTLPRDDAGTGTGDDAGTGSDAGMGGDAGTGPGDDAGTVTDAGTDIDAGTDAGTPTSLVVDAGPDATLCAGASALIGPAPESGLEYSWSPADGLSSASVAQPMASPSTPTTYVLTVSDPVTGQTGSDSVWVTVNTLPVAYISAPSKVCGNSRWNLSGINSTATAPATLTDYSWALGSTQLSGVDAQLTMPAGPASVQATLTVTDSNGCSASSTMGGQVLELPVANAGADRTIGRGSSVQIGTLATGGTAPYRYAWSATPVCPEGSCLSSASVAQPDVMPAESTLFTVVVTDAESCDGSASVQVTVASALMADAGGDKALCAGQSTPVGLPASGGVAPYTYSWSANPECTGCLSNTTEASPTASPTVTTTFTQTVTDATSQTASASTVVTVYPNPGTAGADQDIDPGASVVIGPTPVSGATYAWSCNRADCALSATNMAQPVAGPTRTTTYTLDASSGPGCSARSTPTIHVNLKADTVPQDGETAFPLSSALLVQFDQPIAPATLTASTVQLEETLTGIPVSVSLSYDSTTRQLWVLPTGSNYTSPVEYTLTLAGGAGGIASDDPIQPNLFPSDVQVDFTTDPADGTPPAITFRNPVGGATGVPGNTTVVVAFNEPLDSATVMGTTFVLTSSGGQVAGTVRYDSSSRTATFTPSVELSPSTDYVVSLTNIRDLSGNPLTTSWSFTTGTAPDLTPPTVTAVSPANGATAVASSDPILVTFSESVDTASLTGLRLLQVSTGTSVAGNVSYNVITRVATFTPTVLLGSLTPYEVNVSGVKDLAGNAMTAPFTSSFTTRRTLFADNFESGTGAWNLPAPTTGLTWSLTSANFHSSRNSLTDSAGGKYLGNVVSYAELAAPLSVSGLTSVTVQFWMKARTERSKDFVYVDASIDGGAWTQLTGGRYSGNQAWAVRSLNLPLSGKSMLRIRYRFESNANKSFDGVYVDDIIIQSP